MKCIDKTTIRKYIDKETPGKMTRALENHLADCPQCRSNVETAARETLEFKEKLKLLYPDQVPHTPFYPTARKTLKPPIPLGFILKTSYSLAALALIVLTAVFVLKIIFTPAITPAPGCSRGRYLATAFNEYIEDIKPVIIEYANTTTDLRQNDLIALDKEIAKKLLLRNHLLQSQLTVNCPKDLYLLLEDLEMILTEISNQGRDDPDQIGMLKKFIDTRKTLYKLESVSSLSIGTMET